MIFIFRCCITTKTQVRKKYFNFRTAGALPTNGILIRMTTGARRAQVHLRSHPFNSRRRHDSSNSSIAAAPQPPHRPPSSLRKRWDFFDRWHRWIRTATVMLVSSYFRTKLLGLKSLTGAALWKDGIPSDICGYQSFHLSTNWLQLYVLKLNCLYLFFGKYVVGSDL